MFFGLCICRVRLTVVDVLPVSGELQSKRRGNHRIGPAYGLAKILAYTPIIATGSHAKVDERDMTRQSVGGYIIGLSEDEG
jgi:hypothetical protein